MEKCSSELEQGRSWSYVPKVEARASSAKSKIVGRISEINLSCEDFRDFVLTRIDEIKPGPPADFDPADDLEWENFATLELRPHPGLTEEQSIAIERDYAMSGGKRQIEVRLSMAYYFIMRMNLDLSNLPPARAQICLSNIDEVRMAIEDAKAGSKARIQERKGRASDQLQA